MGSQRLFCAKCAEQCRTHGPVQYDLKTGTLRFKHLLPPNAKGFLNDVAFNSVGEAFTTNTGTGESSALHRIMMALSHFYSRIP